MADTTTEVLEAAWDELEAANAPETPAEAPADAPVETPADTVEPEVESVEAKPDRPRDETGKFVKAEEKPVAKGKPVQASKTPAPAAGKATGTAQPQKAAAAATVEPVAPVTAPTKGPGWLKPLFRERWGEIKPDMQQELSRVFGEQTKLFQENERLKITGGSWTDTLRPYEAIIRQSGMEPAKYVDSVMQTVHALSYGPPQQKAGLLAGLILQFGGDLLRADQQDENGTPSNPLDRALVAAMRGQAQQTSPQTQQPREFRDPRFDQFLARLEERQNSEALETTQSFAETHEFYADVQSHMADILDVWAKQGKQTVSEADLERAYNLACNMNEDVSASLERRKKAEAVRTGAAATARARSAASSVRSQPAAAPADRPQGIDAVLNAAADELGIT